MQDPLGDRIKTKFESPSQTHLPSRGYFILRIDGRAFHTWTKGRPPFDVRLRETMLSAAKTLLRQVPGAFIGYHQSDEVSIVFTDLGREESQVWFGGNVQKIVSVAASVFTAGFNANLSEPTLTPATFDARVFFVSRWEDVIQYLKWRRLDCHRNSLSSYARAHFSHSELNGKSAGEVHDMLHAKGLNWSKLEPEWKNGSVLLFQTYTREVKFTHKRTGKEETATVHSREWVAAPAERWTRGVELALEARMEEFRLGIKGRTNDPD